MPYRVYTGVAKDRLELRTARRAKPWRDPEQAYVSLNKRLGETRVTNAIVLDIDDDYADDSWSRILDLIEVGRLPRPNWTAGRWFKGYAGERFTRMHLVYKLLVPVDEAKPRQRAFLHAILEELYDVLQREGIRVDRRQPVTTKNPASPVWSTIHMTEKMWELREIADVLDISGRSSEQIRAITRARYARKTPARTEGEISGVSRNCDVFDAARVKVYDVKEQCGSLEELISRSLEIVGDVNARMCVYNPLPHSEVRSIAKSIARWTWTHYSAGTEIKDRGAAADRIKPHMSRRQRQAIGAQYTHERRREKSLLKVKRAIADLQADGEAITVSAVARRASIDPKTARRWMRALEAARERNDNAAPEANRGQIAVGRDYGAIRNSFGQAREGSACADPNVASEPTGSTAGESGTKYMRSSMEGPEGTKENPEPDPQYEVQDSDVTRNQVPSNGRQEGERQNLYYHPALPGFLIPYSGMLIDDVWMRLRGERPEDLPRPPPEVARTLEERGYRLDPKKEYNPEDGPPDFLW